jgi:hypothetical protein
MIFLFQEISQFHLSRQAKTNVSGRPFRLSLKGAIDVTNAYKAYSIVPTAAIQSQNHLVYLLYIMEHLIMYKVYDK